MAQVLVVYKDDQQFLQEFPKQDEDPSAEHRASCGIKSVSSKTRQPLQADEAHERVNLAEESEATAICFGRFR